jgi:hypothetical protein
MKYILRGLVILGFIALLLLFTLSIKYSPGERDFRYFCRSNGYTSGNLGGVFEESYCEKEINNTLYRAYIGKIILGEPDPLKRYKFVVDVK